MDQADACRLGGAVRSARGAHGARGLCWTTNRARRRARSVSGVCAVGATRLASLTGSLGSGWAMPTIAFKPYACGTMTQPFIDCAIRLAEDGVPASEITEIVCEVAEATVHRLWEPLAVKHRPPHPMRQSSARRSVSRSAFSIAKQESSSSTRRGFRTRRSSRWLEESATSSMPQDEYPRNFSGHLRVTLKDGSAREYRQPHLRGGAQAPLSVAELETKFMDNARSGGWDRIPGRSTAPVVPRRI